jgi:carbonic anhydrase
MFPKRTGAGRAKKALLRSEQGADMKAFSRGLATISRVTCLILLALYSALGVAKPIFAQEKTAASTHWTYSGPNGPSHWGDLEPDFATCKNGKRESPIDIKNARRDSALPPIQFDYKPSPLKIINNGHTIRVDYAPGSSITVDGKTFPLTQFHFHRPSEEEIAGRKSDMVIHLVHERSDGTAVVAVLVKSGAENPAIQKLWANLPKTEGKEEEVANLAINAADLLPTDRNYYTFDGSLTTPPCSEGVEWFVLKTPIEISIGQIATFAKFYPMNARPIQPMNGREVRESELKTLQ